MGIKVIASAASHTASRRGFPRTDLCTSCSYFGTEECKVNRIQCNYARDNTIGSAQVAKFEARYAAAGVDWRAGLTAPASVRV